MQKTRQNIYIHIFHKFHMARRRLKDHKQRGMKRRMISGKKPMSEEEKAIRKKTSEAQRAETKARLAKKK